MSYLRYLCVFTYSGVQHILGCVFVLFFVVFRILCCQFIWIVHFGLPLWYYLSFIYIDVAVYNDNKYKFSIKACQSIIQKAAWSGCMMVLLPFHRHLAMPRTRVSTEINEQTGTSTSVWELGWALLVVVVR